MAACLHSLVAQSRIPDELLVNNASTDTTRPVAAAIPAVRVVDEPRKGLVVARETGRLAATGDVLVTSTRLPRSADVAGAHRMPGFQLTAAQAARLWTFDSELCSAVLTALVEWRFLVRTRKASFARA